MSRAERRALVRRAHPELSVSRQCRLLSGRALLALLHDPGRERGDPGADAAHCCAVPEASVLRRPADGPSSAS